MLSPFSDFGFENALNHLYFICTRLYTSFFISTPHTYFIVLLEEDERYAWFQQDGATAHMAKKPMDVLTEFFEDRIILKGT